MEHSSGANTGIDMSVRQDEMSRNNPGAFSDGFSNKFSATFELKRVGPPHNLFRLSTTKIQ